MSTDRCRRTAGLVERALVGRGTEADRDHASGCAACSRALARVPAFERELGGALASLATEPMPARLLDVPSSVGSIGAVPSGTGSVARFIAIGAAAVLVVVAAVLLRNPESGPAAPAPLMRSEAAMVASMADLGFSCRSTILGPAASPPLKGSLCTPAVRTSGVDLAAAIERDSAGAVHGVLGKGTAAVDAGAAGRARVEEAMAEIARVAFPSVTGADAAEAWVRSMLPSGSEAVPETTTTIGGLDVRFAWSEARGYQVHVDMPSR